MVISLCGRKELLHLLSDAGYFLGKGKLFGLLELKKNDKIQFLPIVIPICRL